MNIMLHKIYEKEMEKGVLGLSQKKILIFEIILCLLVTVVLILIARFVYVDAFRISYFVFILPQFIIITLINWKKEVNTDNPKLRWFTFLLIAITMVIFAIYKPSFSYQQGKDMVISQGYENLYQLQSKSIFASQLEGTFLVPTAYLYAGEKNNTKYYILLSPINGEIQTEKIGGGNYLDMYFEMYYKE